MTNRQKSNVGVFKGVTASTESFVWFCVCVLLERGLAHDKVKFVINSVETVLQKSVLCSLSRDKFMDAVSCACL